MRFRCEQFSEFLALFFVFEGPLEESAGGYFRSAALAKGRLFDAQFSTARPQQQAATRGLPFESLTTQITFELLLLLRDGPRPRRNLFVHERGVTQAAKAHNGFSIVALFQSAVDWSQLAEFLTVQDKYNNGPEPP